MNSDLGEGDVPFIGDIDTGLKLMETEDAREEIRDLLRNGWFLMAGDYETIALIIGIYLKEGGDWKEAYEIAYGELGKGEVFDIIFVCKKNEEMSALFRKFSKGLKDLSRTLMLRFSGEENGVSQMDYVEGHRDEAIEEILDTYIRASEEVT